MVRIMRGVIAFPLWTTTPQAVEITGGLNFGEQEVAERILRGLHPEYRLENIAA
jgi:hypothetical protein